MKRGEKVFTRQAKKGRERKNGGGGVKVKGCGSSSLPEKAKNVIAKERGK